MHLLHSELLQLCNIKGCNLQTTEVGSYAIFNTRLLLFTILAY